MQNSFRSLNGPSSDSQRWNSLQILFWNPTIITQIITHLILYVCSHSAKIHSTSHYYSPSIKMGLGYSPISVVDNLSWDTWKTGWICAMVGGSQSLYACSPIFCVMQNGLIKNGINFLEPTVGKWRMLKRTDLQLDIPKWYGNDHNGPSKPVVPLT